MKKNIFIALFVIVTFLKGFSQTPPLDISYLGNEGFLIYSKNKKVLVDALFKVNLPSYSEPSDSLINQMTVGKPPYNNIDLLLITHYHGDHFNPDFTISFLENQSNCKLVAHKQVVDVMREKAGFDRVKSRIVEINIENGSMTSLEEKGINLDIVCMSHNNNIETKNLSFMVSIKGNRFFHIGDATIDENIQVLQQYNFDKKPINVIFLQSYDTSSVSKQYITTTIKPEMIIAMHLSADAIDTEAKNFTTHYPYSIIFRKLEQSISFTNTIK
jgi:L-ascorbate metabolism protein UlaG (beta-lactamase superfamily)